MAVVDTGEVGIGKCDPCLWRREINTKARTAAGNGNERDETHKSRHGLVLCDGRGLCNAASTTSANGCH